MIWISLIQHLPASLLVLVSPTRLAMSPTCRCQTSFFGRGDDVDVHAEVDPRRSMLWDWERCDLDTAFCVASRFVSICAHRCSGWIVTRRRRPYLPPAT